MSTTSTARLDERLVGVTSGPRPIAWDADASCLYALAVGAGTDDLASTTDNTSGRPQRALPTMATVLGVDLGVLDRAVAIDWTRLVHTGQSLQLHRPLAPVGSGTATTTVTEVQDKRRAAVVVVTTELTDDRSRPVATGVATLLIDGAGGFGGDRGTREPRWHVDGPPDRVLSTTTRPDQALLYRLTGDHNPLHSDPAFAARAGFDQPILHGLCTFGITGRLLLEACLDDDTTRLASLRARFAAPVVPGDRLHVDVWDDGDLVSFRTRRGDGTVVLSHGVVERR